MELIGNLPKVQENKGFFKTKKEVERLSSENARIQEDIYRSESKPNRWNFYSSDGQDAVSTFEHKLKGVIATTKELTKARSKEDMDKTLDLW